MRLKILARKNLKMTPGKLAAQSVHAALGLALKAQLEAAMPVVVLEVSDKKFQEAVAANECSYVVHDAGYTEVPHGTQTCVAFFEEDPRENTGDVEL
jgi:peptidyl-tRNA hydrolase